jgi:hypothetical protein
MDDNAEIISQLPDTAKKVCADFPANTGVKKTVNGVTRTNSSMH